MPGGVFEKDIVVAVEPVFVVNITKRFGLVWIFRRCNRFDEDFVGIIHCPSLIILYFLKTASRVLKSQNWKEAFGSGSTMHCCKAEAEVIQARLMADGRAPYAFPGGREAVHRGEVKAPGVGMVVREHIDIGPASGAGGDQVGLAALAGLLLGDECGNLDRAYKVCVGPVAGIGVAPPIAESVWRSVTLSPGSSASVAVSTALRARCRGMAISFSANGWSFFSGS